VREATLSPFFLSKFEMSQGQWKNVTGETPDQQVPDGLSPLYPVTMVSWAMCQRTLAWLGLRLPSEAEWEYAARARTTTKWWTGNERDSLRGAVNIADQAAKRANHPWLDIEDWPELDDGYPAFAPVNAFLPNPFGLHNVHGNVWEWCADGDQEHPNLASATDPLVGSKTSQLRVGRGGAYNLAAYHTRVTNRQSYTPGTEQPNLGLRPARAIESESR
jgi:formylglycine-generating enzyme required for sulfatase activity